jgi:hypothetical protein
MSAEAALEARYYSVRSAPALAVLKALYDQYCRPQKKS